MGVRFQSTTVTLEPYFRCFSEVGVPIFHYLSKNKVFFHYDEGSISCEQDKVFKNTVSSEKRY